MPSQRRVRLLFYVVLAGVITLLFFTSHLRQTRPSDTRSLGDFYHKTMEAMNAAQQQQTVLAGNGGSSSNSKKGGASTLDHDGDGTVDEDDEQLARKMQERLQAAEKKAKDSANAKAPNKPENPSRIVGVGSSAGGQKRLSASGGEGKEKSAAQSEEDRAAEQEINTILKKSPIIIFSKSYCPYSKRAKGVLLEKYAIDPVPFVVELDQHPLGKAIQARLADMTGRKTVPNIMVNGKSIGGSDEIVAMDKEKTLAAKLKTLGGKRVEATERFVEDAQKPV